MNEYTTHEQPEADHVLDEWKERSRERSRIEVHSGPDHLGRFHYTRYWWAFYHPGDPAGEYRWAERGQCFFGRLS